mmetsp:Transcript_6492/g.20343  ORF Transcript_6492/g.20343 Transcript_6492/m.20343 type:complete len:80 (-) Transcript_6492:2998-3237(-)
MCLPSCKSSKRLQTLQKYLAISTLHFLQFLATGWINAHFMHCISFVLYRSMAWSELSSWQKRHGKGTLQHVGTILHFRW